MKITKKGSASVSSSEKVEGKRNYGGAYDVDPYQYFTKDDIIEFGDGVAFKLSNIYDMQFRMVDVYIVDYSRIVVELANDDDTLEVTGQADIDMRKVRKPADIHKFADAVIKDIQDDHEIEDFIESVESCSNVTASDDPEYEGPDWPDPNDSAPYEFVATKSVQDSDGFYTDYSMYYDPETNTYFMMFGDIDLTEPDPGYADWECETLDQAWEWFDSYNGFADEEDDIDLSEDIMQSTSSTGVYYPNGKEVTDIDLDTYLDYNFGTDRDMDNSKYTTEEKQRSVDYWFKKHDTIRGSESTYRQGDERTFGTDDDEFYLFEDLAYELKKKSPNKHNYFVKDVYLDFGANWMWTTVVDGSTPGRNVQVMNPRQWLNLVNKVQSPEEIADEILNGEYCQDKAAMSNTDMNFDVVSDDIAAIADQYGCDAEVVQLGHGNRCWYAIELLSEDPYSIRKVYNDIKAKGYKFDREGFLRVAENKYRMWIDGCDSSPDIVMSTTGEWNQKIEEATELAYEDEAEDFEEYEDDIKEIDQEFTSENTSINSIKLPAVFQMVSFAPGTINIDYGGGRFDNVADYLTQYDVINLVYDPYNRTPEHNKEVIKTVRKAGGADTATCSNVLNVIKEPEVRKNVLENIKKLVKSNGTVYITVYEGNGSGEGSPTKSGYQTNRKTADYLDEIKEVFPNATRRGKLIVAKNSSDIASSERVEFGTEGSDSQLQDSEIYQYLEECGGYTDYNQKIEDLCEKFGLTRDDAETYVANYASGLYSDIQSVQKIEADYLDPPEYPELDDVDPWDETIELDVDAYITVDNVGSWIYCDSEGNENEPDGYSFCRSDEKSGDWHSEEHSNILIGDPTDICEDFDSLIEANIPAEPGFYHITCKADLVYEISGAERVITDQWFDEDHGYDYDEEIYTDNAETDFSLEKSKVRDFNFDKIG